MLRFLCLIFIANSLRLRLCILIWIFYLHSLRINFLHVYREILSIESQKYTKCRLDNGKCLTSIWSFTSCVGSIWSTNKSNKQYTRFTAGGGREVSDVDVTLFYSMHICVMNMTDTHKNNTTGIQTKGK